MILNELFQWLILGVLVTWIVILEIHLRDLKWRMSKLFDTWKNLQENEE
ncbi:hypothetical protein ES705_26869 [subsurface metagenome]